MYPPGIVTRTCTVGGATAQESGDPLILSVVVASSRGLIWAATGWRLPSLPRTVASTVGSEATFDLPVTSQAGFRSDSSPGTIIDVSAPGSYSHTYTATVTITTPAGGLVSQSVIGPFPLPAEDLSPVDLDTMLPVGTVAGGAVLVPDSWDVKVAAAEAAAAGAGGYADQAEASALVAAEAAVAARVKHPVTALTWTGPIAGRSVGQFATNTHATPIGTAYAIDNGWVARTLDGWVTRTNGLAFEASGNGSCLRLVAWSDGSLCAVTSTKVVTMASISSAQVVTLTAEYAFSGLPVAFWESGPTRYVIIGEYNQATATPKKLYLSKDGGATFSVIKLGATTGVANNHWHGVAFDPYANAIWAAYGDELPNMIYYSLDLGTTWNQCSAPQAHLQPTLILPLPNRVVFGRDGAGIDPGMDQWIRPSNTQPTGVQPVTLDALTFEQAESSFTFYPEARMSAVVPGKPDQAYIAFPRRNASGLPSYIYATGDGGASWHLVYSTPSVIQALATDGTRLFFSPSGGTLYSAPLLQWDWTTP